MDLLIGLLIESQIIPHLESLSYGFRKRFRYIISKNDEKEILMLLTYLPMSQHMNNVLYAKYLDQILTK